jgi:hypothetical protein
MKLTSRIVCLLLAVQFMPVSVEGQATPSNVPRKEYIYMGRWPIAAQGPILVGGPANIAAKDGGSWVIDLNGNFVWDGTPTDRLSYWSFGSSCQSGETPVVGDWNGDGRTKIGVYCDGTWLLDYNGNGVWDGSGVDKLIYFGGPGYMPVVGDWNGSGWTKIGAYSNGTWVLDYNGNFTLDGTGIDKSLYFGGPGYAPAVGDWNGSGWTKVGAYVDGTWLLDYNGNFVWDGTSTDKLLNFGAPGYTRVVGDWNRSGWTKIGAYKDGVWMLDFNGNFAWDGTETDKSTFFGGPGQAPVVGKWNWRRPNVHEDTVDCFPNSGGRLLCAESGLAGVRERTRSAGFQREGQPGQDAVDRPCRLARDPAGG